MRVKILLSGTNVLVPINNQHILNSYIHNCLGENNKYHDAKSNYVISNLNGGKLNKLENAIDFKNGAYFIVSSYDDVFIGTLLNGITKNLEFGYGMKYCGVTFVNENFHNGWNYFKTLSPILLKKYSDKKSYTFKTINDADYVECLTEHVKSKLLKIDSTLNFKDFKIVIEPRTFNKIRKVMVKNVKNIATQCQINIFTTEKIAGLIYNYGIGQSTGCGFGCIYKSENHHIYREDAKI